MKGSASGMEEPFAHLRRGAVGLEVLLQLWRSKWLILLLFMPPFVVSAAVVMTTPSPYVATVSLLIAPEPGRGYDLLVGMRGAGAVVAQEDLVNAERDLALSEGVVAALKETVGVGRLDPGLATQMLASNPQAKVLLERRALDGLARSLGAEAEKGSSVLHLSVRHADRGAARDILAAWLKVYLAARDGALEADEAGGASPLLEQRRAVEGRLKEAEAAIAGVLAGRGLSDLVAERERLQALDVSLARETSLVEADIRQEEARAAALGRQMASTPSTTELFAEAPVFVPPGEVPEPAVGSAGADLEARVSRLEQAVASRGPAAVRRTGPNPLYQDMAKDAARTRQTLAALRARSEDLARQRRETDARLAEVAAAAPDYDALARDRDALRRTADELASVEEARRASRDLSARQAGRQATSDRVRLSGGGASRRWGLMVGALLSAGFALGTGIIISMFRRGLPSASALSRRTGLSVIGAVSERRS